MSELRQDLVSGDWIIMAPERAKRPHDLLPRKKPRVPSPKNLCPFEDMGKSGNGPAVLSYPDAKHWRVMLIPNKYPALRHETQCPAVMYHGPSAIMDGAGYHDLLVTKDHKKNFAEVSLDEATKVFELFQERYRMMSRDSCMFYTSVFFNWGLSAGASLFHPHYQVVSLPIVPPHVLHSLKGSEHYYKKHRECVHCLIIDAEKKEKRRVVLENASGIVLAPFASHLPFALGVFPKKHLPSFEETSLTDLRLVAELLQNALKSIKRYLHDPDLNFFIHTAPLKEKRKYGHYHWHIEIVPKISISAGFELGTGVLINIVDPDKAAAILRGER